MLLVLSQAPPLQLVIADLGRFSLLSAFAVTNRQEFVHGICALSSGWGKTSFASEH
jgi:hypothetical protein